MMYGCTESVFWQIISHNICLDFSLCYSQKDDYDYLKSSLWYLEKSSAEETRTLSKVGTKSAEISKIKTLIYFLVKKLVPFLETLRIL